MGIMNSKDVAELYYLGRRNATYETSMMRMHHIIEELSEVWENIDVMFPDKLCLGEPEAVASAQDLILDAVNKLKDAKLRLKNAEKYTRDAFNTKHENA